MKEVTHFDPAAVQAELEKNFAAGLRMIADAVDSGQMDGRFWGSQGNGFTSRHDQRAHILITVDLAAHVVQSKEVAVEPLEAGL